MKVPFELATGPFPDLVEGKKHAGTTTDMVLKVKRESHPLTSGGIPLRVDVHQQESLGRFLLEHQAL